MEVESPVSNIQFLLINYMDTMNGKNMLNYHFKNRNALFNGYLPMHNTSMQQVTTNLHVSYKVKVATETAHGKSSFFKYECMFYNNLHICKTHNHIKF